MDSYHFNIAAFRLAEMVALGEMMPVTVERTWNGRDGSLTWWVDNAMEEGERRDEKEINPPDLVRWNAQMFRLRVFARLVADTDRNLGNVLIDPAWQLWMMRPHAGVPAEPRYPVLRGISARCDRAVLEALRRLTQYELARVVGPHLKRRDITALVGRRGALVQRHARPAHRRARPGSGALLAPAPSLSGEAIVST